MISFTVFQKRSLAFASRHIYRLPVRFINFSIWRAILFDGSLKFSFIFGNYSFTISIHGDFSVAIARTSLIFNFGHMINYPLKKKMLVGR